MKPTFGSLFSGIGGLDLGLERAGWSCRWQVEADPFRQHVLREHWPHIKLYGDIEDVDFTSVEHTDLIAGGFPCQPVSSAGKKLAQSDRRWLWPEFYRAVRILGPKLILVENVTGLLYRGFGDILRDLALSGYDAEWVVLPAVITGAPHVRARVWIVAYTSSWRQQRYSDIEEVAPVVFCGRLIATADAPNRGATSWAIEPGLVRMVDGLSGWMDERIAALGDAVVPQLAEWIGSLLLAALARDGEA